MDPELEINSFEQKTLDYLSRPSRTELRQLCLFAEDARLSTPLI
jgi:hypothetical protein